MKQTDFGKGLVYNLILFTNHFSNEQASQVYNYHFVMSQSEQERAMILSNDPDNAHNYGFNDKVKWWYDHIVPIWETPEKALSHQIEIWCNGATDHLYELCIETSNKQLNLKLKTLQTLGLAMGHGWTQYRNEICTWKNFIKLQELTKECARMIDKMLGIEVMKARWE